MGIVSCNNGDCSVVERRGRFWIKKLLGRLEYWSKNLSNRALAISLAVGICACVIYLTRPPIVFQFLWEQELRVEDQLFAWRHEVAKLLGYQQPPCDDIVIVNIDDESQRRLGLFAPWPRSVYASILRTLEDAGARVIGFTFSLEGPSPLSRGAGDSQTAQQALQSWQKGSQDDATLAAQLAKSNNVVLSTSVDVATGLFTERSRLVFHKPDTLFIAGEGNLGNVIAKPDVDGVVRRASLIYEEFRGSPPFIQSFGLRLAQHFWNTEPIYLDDSRLLLGRKILPVSFRINYLGSSGTFRTIPFWKALHWQQHFAADDSSAQGADKNPFKDKIVLLGFQDYAADGSAASSSPSRLLSLPANTVLTPASGVSRPMSVVELQSNILANILSAHYLSEAEPWEVVLILIFVALLFGRIFGALKGHPWASLACVVGFAGLWACACLVLFVRGGCVMPVLVPAMGVAFPAWFLVIADQNVLLSMDRRRHTRVFQRLAGQTLAEEIGRRKLGELELEGKRARITMLLCEVDGLTEMTAGADPQAIIHAYNQMIQIMIATVSEHNGVVERLWSHGVTAIWGAPIAVQEKSQARLAANCMLDIDRHLSSMVERWKRRDDNICGSLEVRCSITTGDVVCGRLGPPEHTEYGAVGPSVDLALRLGLLNRRYGSKCILGENSAALIGEQFEIRELDKVKLDSGGQPLYIYELLGKKGRLSGKLEEAVVLYRQGRAAMAERNFSEAERVFASILRLLPDDRPTIKMLELCRSLLSNPPQEEWDGANMVTLDGSISEVKN